MIYLKPSNIFYSQHQISATFGKWNRHRNTTIGETLDDLCNGRCKISDIETIKVVKKDGKWCTIDNRRLWVFHHLEAAGKCTKVPVEVVQFCPVTHGFKFSITNDGKFVTIIQGNNPGGIWHKRLIPVTPAEEKKDQPEMSESESIVNNRSYSEKDTLQSNGSVNRHLPVPIDISKNLTDSLGSDFSSNEGQIHSEGSVFLGAGISTWVGKEEESHGSSSLQPDHDSSRPIRRSRRNRRQPDRYTGLDWRKRSRQNGVYSVVKRKIPK